MNIYAHPNLSQNFIDSLHRAAAMIWVSSLLAPFLYAMDHRNLIPNVPLIRQPGWMGLSLLGRANIPVIAPVAQDGFPGCEQVGFGLGRTQFFDALPDRGGDTLGIPADALKPQLSAVAQIVPHNVYPLH